MSTDVDHYIARSDLWPDELRALRPVLLEAGLDEAIKWNKPCYSHDGANIAIMQEMKDFLALMFFKGALLDDPAGVLEDQLSLSPVTPFSRHSPLSPLPPSRRVN